MPSLPILTPLSRPIRLVASQVWVHVHRDKVATAHKACVPVVLREAHKVAVPAVVPAVHAVASVVLMVSRRCC